MAGNKLPLLPRGNHQTNSAPAAGPRQRRLVLLLLLSFVFALFLASEFSHDISSLFKFPVVDELPPCQQQDLINGAFTPVERRGLKRRLGEAGVPTDVPLPSPATSLAPDDLTLVGGMPFFPPLMSDKVQHWPTTKVTTTAFATVTTTVTIERINSAPLPYHPNKTSAKKSVETTATWRLELEPGLGQKLKREAQLHIPPSLHTGPGPIISPLNIEPAETKEILSTRGSSASLATNKRTPNAMPTPTPRPTSAVEPRSERPVFHPGKFRVMTQEQLAGELPTKTLDFNLPTVNPFSIDITRPDEDEDEAKAGNDGANIDADQQQARRSEPPLPMIGFPKPSSKITSRPTNKPTTVATTSRRGWHPLLRPTDTAPGAYETPKDPQGFVDRPEAKDPIPSWRQPPPSKVGQPLDCIPGKTCDPGLLSTDP